VASNRVRQSWSPEAYALARQARSLNFLKIEPLIQKLQQAFGRSRRDCLVLIHRCAQERPKRRSGVPGKFCASEERKKLA